VQGDVGDPAIPYTTFTGIDPFNFTVNTNWVRLKYYPTAGTVDKVQLRN